MRRALLITLSACLCLSPTPCAAQEDSAMPPNVVIPETEIFDIHSTHAEADFQLWVAEPIAGMMPFPPGPRGVVYVLDANMFFGTAVEMTRVMSQLYGELPPLLIVGIAYDTASPALQAELRSRDFTPSTDARLANMAQAPPGAPAPTLPAEERLGRADEFLRFLTDEARPFIEERYEVAENSSTLFGSSLGGLLAIHALVERPSAFDAYIAVSPALWWDEQLVMRREAEAAAARNDLDVSVFLTVGEFEERAEIPALAPFRMVSNVREFSAQLESRNYKSLRLATRVAEGESHTTVVPGALTRGLRFVYGSASQAPR